MKTMSAEYELSKAYTNHCLRATTITNLDSLGFASRHIMCVSGHRSESSIKSYSSHVPEAAKREMSLGLSSLVSGVGIQATDAVAEPPPIPQDPPIDQSTGSDLEMVLTNSQEDDLLKDLQETFALPESHERDQIQPNHANGQPNLAYTYSNTEQIQMPARNTAMTFSGCHVTINYL